MNRIPFSRGRVCRSNLKMSIQPHQSGGDTLSEVTGSDAPANTGPSELHSRRAPLRRIYLPISVMCRMPRCDCHPHPQQIGSASLDPLPRHGRLSACLFVRQPSLRAGHGTREGRQQGKDGRGGTFHPSPAPRCLTSECADLPRTRSGRRRHRQPWVCS